ncbi:MAG: radical SAM protein, partial [Propionibacteriaceae bacterium]|nr:radical SAM protein [Propionibacteriaceae bacterium]
MVAGTSTDWGPTVTLATQPLLGLRDAYGRVARDLRVSLTDRCNLRCSYCMPAEGLAWLPGRTILTDDEIVRLVRVAVGSLGVDTIRFTGGEPLLRPGLAAIIAAVRELETHAGSPPGVALTTNGIGLDARAEELRAA